jgi:hypothetical protein|tara:strand:- start:114 stop:728 length:615 start_codon:yes stop_codon:yes gene_type:complete
MNIEPIFPIGLLVHDVPEAIADEVEKFVVSRIDKMPSREPPADQPGAPRAPHSTDYFESKKIIGDLPKDLPRLWVELCSCKDKYQEANNFKAINRQLQTNKSEFEWWCQDYIEGDFHHEHEHGIGRISGIYWVRANDAAGGIMFRNPNPFTEYSQDYDSNSIYSWQGNIHNAVKGKVLMFPSYLKHSVLISGKGAERTTIAFNF